MDHPDWFLQGTSHMAALQWMFVDCVSEREEMKTEAVTHLRGV